MKIGPGVSELWGSRIALSHWQGHGLYNSLYYRTSRDSPHIRIKLEYVENLCSLKRAPIRLDTYFSIFAKTNLDFFGRIV